MKTAAALALCLVATAATSDDEQAQARARLLLQRAVEEVRAGVLRPTGPSGFRHSAPLMVQSG